MSERLRFNTQQAAEFTGRHPDTIRRALESGDLHGGQRKKNGRWSIRVTCLEAWVDGEKCEHQKEAAA